MPGYRWAAKYDDGTVVNQYGSDAKEQSTNNLDRARVVSFALWDHETRKPVLTLHLERGQKLIYRRRVEQPVGAAEPVEVCYLVGWRRTMLDPETGRTECVQAIAYVFEKAGRIELAGRFDEKHPWFYSPVLRPYEE